MAISSRKLIGLFFTATLALFICAENLTAQDTKFQWRFETVDGKNVNPFESKSTKAIVAVFVSTDCPIANAYHPYLKTLHGSYSGKGIDFYLIHSASYITKSEAEKHVKEYDLKLPVVLDSKQSIAKHLKAKVTPEVFVLSSRTKKPIYRGAIDNLYAGYGKKRAKATEHYLKDAIESFLSGKEVTVSTTKPIGCFISYDK